MRQNITTLFDSTWLRLLLLPLLIIIMVAATGQRTLLIFTAQITSTMYYMRWLL
eukprot:COSAG05_NODE_13851_length_416_cov_1.078864_2_plen_53_part_01